MHIEVSDMNMNNNIITTRDYSIDDYELVRIINKLLATTDFLSKGDIRFMMVSALTEDCGVSSDEVDEFIAKLD